MREEVEKVRTLVRAEPGLTKEVADRLVDEHFHVAALRNAPSWDVYPGTQGGKPGLHSKLIIVDDDAFYIGSHNLYEANLSEFGFIVDDQPATATVVQSLWEPMWASSSHTVGTF